MGGSGSEPVAPPMPMEARLLLPAPWGSGPMEEDSMRGAMESLRQRGWAVLALAVGAAFVMVLWTATADARRGCKRDADCDKLTNQEERALGTSRSSADSDGDGLSDGVEVKRIGTDPLDSDTDHDGVDDGDEMADGTEPRDSDSDHDGEHDGDDDDPMGELKPKLVGPVDGVNAEAKTVAMFGCLTIDVSAAVMDDALVLTDLMPGMVVKIILDRSKLPALVATELQREDGDSDGVPDEREDD